MVTWRTRGLLLNLHLRRQETTDSSFETPRSVVCLFVWRNQQYPPIMSSSNSSSNSFYWVTTTTMLLLSHIIAKKKKKKISHKNTWKQVVIHMCVSHHYVYWGLHPRLYIYTFLSHSECRGNASMNTPEVKRWARLPHDCLNWPLIKSAEAWLINWSTLEHSASLWPVLYTLHDVSLSSIIPFHRLGTESSPFPRPYSLNYPSLHFHPLSFFCFSSTTP